MKRDIALLLADVDGTLVDENKTLTPRAIGAVRALREKGVHFAVTSGRPPRGMAMLIEPLALDTAIAGFNGGVFVNPDLSVIETHRLQEDAAREALRLMEEAGLDTWLYTDTEWLLRNKGAPHVAREAWTVKFEARVVPAFDDALLAKAVKVVGVSDDHARVAACEEKAQQVLGERASAARSQPYYLDVTDRRANKGEVVMRLARMFNIEPARIATIGDSRNDMLMFARAGFSIAMGQASDEVKKAASVVTDGHNADGFAKAVERFLLDDAP